MNNNVFGCGFDCNTLTTLMLLSCCGGKGKSCGVNICEILPAYLILNCLGCGCGNQNNGCDNAPDCGCGCYK